VIRVPKAPVLVALGTGAILGVRAWAASRISTPWILVDELLYSDLARSLAAEGRLAVRGETTVTSLLYPALVAPAWLARDMETTYALAKSINVVAMSAAAVPVYAWTRRLAGPRAGLVAAGLTLLLPAFVYTGSLLTENLFLPLFLGSAYTLARALESPSPARWLLAFGFVALAAATRLQGLVLLPIVVTAAAVYAGLELRHAGRARAGALWPLVAWAALPTAGIAVVAVRGSIPGLSSGPYAGVLQGGDYGLGEVARWVAYDAGAVVLASGVVPFVALSVFAGRAVSRAGSTTRGERAFVATAVSAVAWLVALAGLTSTWDPVGIRERYAVHAVPLLFVALVAWLARGRPRPIPLAAAAAAVAVALVAILPLGTIFGSQSFLGDGFTLIPFWRLARVLPGGVDAARALLVAGALGAALLALLLTRRRAAVALPALVAAFLIASSAAVFATARSQSRGVALASGQADDPAWIDDAVGDDPVAFLSLVPTEAPGWVPVWQAEFWNRSIASVVAVGAAEPSPLPQETATLGRHGLVTGVEPRPFVLVRSGAEVAGTLVAESGGLRLYRVELPLRVVRAPK
jgi:hypothetical protein